MLAFTGVNGAPYSESLMLSLLKSPMAIAVPNPSGSVPLPTEPLIVAIMNPSWTEILLPLKQMTGAARDSFDEYVENWVTLKCKNPGSCPKISQKLLVQFANMPLSSKSKIGCGKRK